MGDLIIHFLQWPCLFACFFAYYMEHESSKAFAKTYLCINIEPLAIVMNATIPCNYYSNLQTNLENAFRLGYYGGLKRKGEMLADNRRSNFLINTVKSLKIGYFFIIIDFPQKYTKIRKDFRGSHFRTVIKKDAQPDSGNEYLSCKICSFITKMIWLWRLPQ